MAAIDTTINSIIQQSRRVDPAIADAFILLSKEVQRIGNLVDPPPVTQSKTNAVPLPPPLDVTVGSYSFTDTNVILTWDAPSTDLILYEVRQGIDWDTADRILVTGDRQAILDPTDIGTTSFLIKTLNSSGIYSLTPLQIDVVVPAIGSFTLTPSVINNSISIDWDEPVSTFRVAYYIITKDGAVLVTRLPGTFFSRQESEAGSFTYGVTAVDIHGNTSAEIQVTADVSAPTDFEIQDSQTSNLSGTIVNGLVDGSKLYVGIDTTISYEDHFINNAWASPQAQVTAGYPIWVTPSEINSSYQEIFDFGIIYSNVIVNLSWLFEQIAGTHVFTLDVRVSDDGITYTAPTSSSSFFVTSARYVKVKFDFTGGTDKSLLAFSQFICTLNVKREIDGSDQAVFAADASGTVVTFAKAFKFVESITVTVKDTSLRVSVYSFAGGANPTSFKVLVFNSAGVRQDATISWKARGVL
jgi:hypothetical protein